MQPVWRGKAMFVGLIALCGCHPHFTRVPDFVPRTVQQDKLEWNYFDPLPDDEAGPTTDHRPAGFDRQRAMPRKALEKNSVIFQPRMPWEPPREEARLNGRYFNTVEP